MTVCLYLPDGRVGFMFKRPEIANNDAFDAGGMKWEIVTPFEELNVELRGQGRAPRRPARRWPTRRRRSPRTRTPSAEVAHHVHRAGRAIMFGGEPDEPHETPGEEFAKGHYEQLVAGSGRSGSASEEWHVDGFGLRDHSWGPRYWQAPWYYRWLTANFGATSGSWAAGSPGATAEGTRGGFVWEDGKLHFCDSLELKTTYEGDEQLPPDDLGRAAIIPI